MIVTHSIHPFPRQPSVPASRLFAEVMNFMLIIKHTLLLRELCGQIPRQKAVNINRHTCTYSHSGNNMVFIGTIFGRSWAGH